MESSIVYVQMSTLYNEHMYQWHCNNGKSFFFPYQLCPPVRRADVTSTYPSDLSRLTNIESLRQGRGRGCILLLQLHLPGSSTRFHYRLSL